MKKSIIVLLSVAISYFIQAENITQEQIDVLFDTPTESFSINGPSVLMINDDSVNIREFPKLDSKVIGKVNYQDKLQLISHEYETQTIEGYVGHWVKVKFGMKVGYVFSKFLGSGYQIGNNQLIITKENSDNQQVSERISRIVYNRSHYDFIEDNCDSQKLFTTKYPGLYILVISKDSGGERLEPTYIFALQKKIDLLIHGKTSSSDGGFHTYKIYIGDDSSIKITKIEATHLFFVETNGSYSEYTP